jgi:hypothetical protein
MEGIRLIDLEPEFLKKTGEATHNRIVKDISEADGICFLCPKCYRENLGTDKGVHSIICWQPHIPESPLIAGPGRWRFEGTGYEDLTLVNGSSSVALKGGCNAHFWVRDGKIVDC